MGQRVLRLAGMGKRIIFGDLLMFPIQLLCAVALLGFVRSFSAEVGDSAETLSIANDAVSSGAQSPRAAENALGSTGQLLETQRSTKYAGADSVKSRNTEDHSAELRPLPELGIGMEILGGLALLLWIQRLR